MLEGNFTCPPKMVSTVLEVERCFRDLWEKNGVVLIPKNMGEIIPKNEGNVGSHGCG